MAYELLRFLATMHSVRTEMTRRVAYVTEADDLDKAFTLMRALEIQHVPVVRDERLIGMLSDRDVLAHSIMEDGRLRVPRLSVVDAMTADVIACESNASIGLAVDLLLQHQVHALPVVNGRHHLLGIVTSSDLLRLLKDRAVELQAPIPYFFERQPLLQMVA